MIAIIGAMEEEITLLKESMIDLQTWQKAGLTFYQGNLNKQRVVLVRCGVGKVHAAMCTQMMIDQYQPDYIFNIGVAGSIDKDLRIADIVISNRLAQHDMDVCKYGYAKGQVPGIDSAYFQSEKKLINLALDAASDFPEITIKQGDIVSGDIFVSKKEDKERIQLAFPTASCVEMEGASIAHVAFLNQIPFLVIRAISDQADEGASISFDNFVQQAAIASKKLMLAILSRFSKA